MLFPFLQMSKLPGRILAQDRTSVKCQGPLRLRTIRPSRHADVFWDEDSSALLLSEPFFPHRIRPGGSCFPICRAHVEWVFLPWTL